jgi:iron complex outermembrane receptor protein
LIHALLLAGALAVAAGDSVTVVDDGGRPVAGAVVLFTDAAGRTDRETTSADGRAAAAAGFDPVAADVTKAGFIALHVLLGRSGDRLVLARVLPVIGAVSVATGSQKSLHALPLAASLLDRSAIALAPAGSADRLLRSLPGFDRTRSNSAFTNYGQLRASFSGAGNDRGLVLVDGLPAQDGFGGQIDWQAYPVDSLERAELLRGAGSALYGSGAIGGVLDLETFAPRPGRLGGADGRVTLGAGSSSNLDNGIQFRTPVGADVGFSLSSVAKRFAYSDLPPSYASSKDHAAVSSSGSTNLRARYDDGTTTVDGSLLFASDHQDEGRTNYTFDRTLRQNGLSATHAFGATLARIGYFTRDTTVYNLADIFPQSPGVQRYNQHVPTNESGFYASLAAQPGTTELSVLVDERRIHGSSVQDGPTGALQASGNGTERARGVGLQATFHSRRAELLVGARADSIRYDDLALANVSSANPPITTVTTVAGYEQSAVSPRAALRYDLSSRVALRLSSGGGFRAPFLNELVRGFNVGKVVMAPNPNLIPERSRTDDAGVDVLVGNDGRFAFDVTQTHVNNAIAFVTLSPTLMRRENFDETETQSETLTYAQRLGPCARVRLSGTTQNARVTRGPGATTGKFLALVPTRSASVGVDATGRGALSYSLDASYVGQTYYDDLNAQPLGAALLVGATIRATTASGTTFSLVGDNLTHQQYLSSIDRFGPPLSIGLRVGIPIGPASAQPASSCGR